MSTLTDLIESEAALAEWERQQAPGSLADLYRDQHAEALMLGLGCPFDCAACDAAANRHTHPSACGHPVNCYDEACGWTEPGEPVRPGFAPVVACDACQPAARPDVPCDAALARALAADPWGITPYADGIPF